MMNTRNAFAAGLLVAAHLAGLGGCASPHVQPQAVVSLRRWELLDLLERERSVAVVREPPAPLSVSSYSVGMDMINAGGAVGSAGVGGVLGLALIAAALPVAIAEGATAAHRQKGLEPLVVDPITAVEQRIVSALRAEPALSGIDWKTATGECGGGPCGSPFSLRLRTTERGVCASPGWIAYGAELRVVRTEGAEPLWQGKCLRVHSAAPIELPGAFSKEQQEGFARELQRKLDTLAGECGEQLVTALLGRGTALSDEPPPYCN